MEDLFVQEPAIVSEKSKTGNQVQRGEEISKEEVKVAEKNTYSHDEAVEASRKYFNGDDLAARVWANKYALKDSFGNLFEKSPDDMHRRLAREIHRIELKYKNPLPEELIYNVLKEFRYIVPQGGPMTGIGNDYQIASLSNCFVIGNDGTSDSYGGIMKIDQEQVQLMKRRGGVGHDLSHIRPKGTPVLNSALTSTGVVPFMESTDALNLCQASRCREIHRCKDGERKGHRGKCLGEDYRRLHEGC
jgi:ribonucleoside-diphosphate reductase alpha chain